MKNFESTVIAAATVQADFVKVLCFNDSVIEVYVYEKLWTDFEGPNALTKAKEYILSLPGVK